MSPSLADGPGKGSEQGVLIVRDEACAVLEPTSAVEVDDRPGPSPQQGQPRAPCPDQPLAGLRGPGTTWTG